MDKTTTTLEQVLPQIVNLAKMFANGDQHEADDIVSEAAAYILEKLESKGFIIRNGRGQIRLLKDLRETESHAQTVNVPDQHRERRHKEPPSSAFRDEGSQQPPVLDRRDPVQTTHLCE